MIDKPAGGGMPQIVLNVPPEVTTLLRSILGCLQRLEQEVREAKLRMAWQRPATAAERPSVREVAARDAEAPIAGKKPIMPVPAPLNIGWGGARATHTPAGEAAAKRMKALQARLGITGTALAERLGVTQSAVSAIGSGRSGIGHRVHEAMKKLEASAR